MSYDIIGGFGEHEDEEEMPYTLGKLVEILEANPKYRVVFVGAEFYSIGELRSWRGSHEIPSLTYTGEIREAKVIAKKIRKALKEEHYGYKGGKYKYELEDTFYVSESARAEQYKVVDFKIEDEKLILMTKKFSY